jgi:hypothetical protein
MLHSALKFYKNIFCFEAKHDILLAKNFWGAFELVLPFKKTYPGEKI